MEGEDTPNSGTAGKDEKTKGCLRCNEMWGLNQFSVRL